ncbi:MAG: hypothetical protein QQN41_03585 [Nitrosopumilus sp.]
MTLAQFNPTYKDEYGHQVLDYLVLDALATYDTLFPVTPTGIKSYIKDVFKLDFDESEIVTSAKRLANKKIINYKESKDRFEYPDFNIKPEYQQKIQKNLAYIQQLENDVIENWKQELIQKYQNQSLINDKIEAIVENLHFFVSKMFLRHGIESVSLLYPDSSKTQGWLNQIKDSILEEIPPIDPFVDVIVKIEVPNFFKISDEKRKTYISSLFNSSFYWHLIQVDENCSRLLKEVTKGQRLYLDNNILFSLVAFHGASVLKSVHNLLKFAKELGYDIWVTTKTIDEFHNSLNWKLKEYRKRQPIPRELARIAAENLDRDNFIVYYWQEFVKTGISIEEFISEKSHIEAILEAFQIEVTNKFRKDIENSTELVQEESLLRQACGESLNENIVQHDAFHRILISKIRKGHKHHFRDAVAWFLTHDSKLPRFGRFARKGANYLPFCITTDQWIQINRPLLARTSNKKEYEESFHTLITQPFLRTMIPTYSLENAYHHILAKLAKYKKMSPKLALEIIADNHFVVSMALEEDEYKIEEKIENKFVDLADKLKEKNINLEKNVQHSSEELIALRKKLSQIEGIVTKFGKQNKLFENKVKELEKNLKTEQEERESSKEKIPKLSELIVEEKSKTSKAIEQAQNNENKFQHLKGQNIRWGIFIPLFLFGSIIIWLHSDFVNWQFLDTHKNNFLIKLSAQVALFFALLNIPIKKQWVNWVMIIMGIFTVIITLLAK